MIPPGDIWVRARSGSFYRNPLVVFAEGFICFDAAEPAELVVWLDAPQVDPPNSILARVLGLDSFDSLLTSPHLHAERIQPGSDPEVWTQAQSYQIHLLRRIPMPAIHEGQARYMRDESPILMDFPSHTLDGRELTVPDLPRSN